MKDPKQKDIVKSYRLELSEYATEYLFQLNRNEHQPMYLQFESDS